MLTVGSPAPDFTLPDQHGNDTSLASLLQQGPLILYFYPADFTPGCTREACSIRDMHGDILSAGLRVAGISPQDSVSHRKFREELGLPFLLLSDLKKTVIRLYDVDGPLGIGVRRGTYLIDAGGVIRAALLADFRIGRHEDFIREAVELGGKPGNQG
jgi:thioredoxin-dependent peroxiredoxin